MAKNNEQVDLFDALVLTRNKYLSSQEEEEKIYAEMKEKLDEAKRKIKLSYQEKINLSKENRSTLQKDLENYKKLLETYSTFNAEMIGNVIEKLVSLVEGEEYCYQEAKHETYEYKSTVFGKESFKINKNLLMIVKGNHKQGYYCDYDEQNNEIHKLVKSSQAFVLTESKFGYKKQVTFYTANEGSMQSLIDFNKFGYVKTFINLVVQYRFEKHLDKISEKELLSIMNEFILSETEMIEDNYQKRAMEKQDQLRKKLLKEQLEHDKEMKLMELETILKNGAPRRYSNNLIDRLQEIASNNTDFNISMDQFEILYEGKRYPATITYSEPLVSLENIFISKINIESSIKNYFDDSDPDPHFHGECDIDLVDDGLIGIVDISNLIQDVDSMINSYFHHELYKVDRINDTYLRILYLPNRGKYSHKPTNVYNWIIKGILDKDDKNSTEEKSSYKIEWNSTEESERMLTYLKEIESLSSFNEKQLQLYKKRKI